MSTLVRKALTWQLPRVELWLAATTVVGFSWLLLSDAIHPLVVLILQLYLVF